MLTSRLMVLSALPEHSAQAIVKLPVFPPLETPLVEVSPLPMVEMAQLLLLLAMPPPMVQQARLPEARG